MLSKGQLSRYGSVLLALTLLTLLPWASWGQVVDRNLALATARQLSAAFATVASQVKPAVVNISTTTIIPGRPPLLSLFPELSRFFEIPERAITSLGSGFLISPDGLVVTNYHVIEGAQQIKVKLADGREFMATVHASDIPSDLAIIRVAAQGLSYLTWGDSSRLQVGEWVVAVGSPLGLSQTVTAGIVSATGRTGLGLSSYEDFIQTDAAINPGNSGGPLVNLEGKVIGINTAIASKSGGSEGISFAVPSNIAQPVCRQLIVQKYVTRAWLGIIPQELTAELARRLGVSTDHGVVVYNLYRNGPAHEAGLRRFEVLADCNGQPISGTDALSRLIANTPPGTAVQFTVWSKNEARTVVVTLGQRPHPQPRQGRVIKGL